MNQPGLRTARLRLRPLGLADVDALLPVYIDPHGSQSLAEINAELEGLRGVVSQRRRTAPDGMGHWVFIQQDRIIGLGKLRPSDQLPGRVPEIGWRLARSHRGRGLATEAAGCLLAYGFQRLGLPAVWALVQPANKPSLAVAERLHFLDVGEGHYHDEPHRVLVALPGTVGGLHHVELWVPDLDRAEATLGWLLGELGWVAADRWSVGVSWRLGRTCLVIEASPGRTDDRHDRLRPGLNHLALHAGSRARVDELTAAAVARGWRLMFGERHPYAGGEQHYAAYLENEDGFEVELVADTVGDTLGAPSISLE